MPQKINKVEHIEPGLQIKIVLARCDRLHKEYDSWHLIPGSIHTITDRPSKKSSRNGNFGIWVDGPEKKVFVRFFEYIPYIAPIKMVRNISQMVRRKGIEMTRRH